MHLFGSDALILSVREAAGEEDDVEGFGILAAIELDTNERSTKNY